ncbi:MAG: transketolase C-terminal domain-containing protein [Humidesulfovibrio sp.]|uniref:alpha-ketoacid dehydrogenase subunit beta n=1 Tax=Humidesulfovibrio sp. TaxID=2910988 RepID=UPI0027343D9F|nr:transketolase C-terminal domain-containing protein [Humidesulfovibrio sp.]MDP2847927.1 transketolase C-terminal domain-containing protein [Humidesulfovibrio sp.]
MPWSRIKPDTNEPDFSNDVLLDNKAGRRIAYAEALNEALFQALSLDPRVFVMGQGVDDPSGMFGATRGLHLKFGADRVFDTPLAETALSGVAVGAALGGMRPVYFHNRPDFLLLAMDQLVNHAAKWHYMFGGAACVPLVFWACVGRGWGSAAQHSQALQGLFMHVPGLKLIMPATCFDAKGLMLSAIADKNPVLIIDHRMNFKQRGLVPEEPYTVPIGKGVIRRKGRDVTVVAISHLVAEAYAAAQELAEEGIEAEIIDPRTLRPLDEELILESVARTGRLVVTDTGWKTGGVTAEIGAMVAEKGFASLKAPIVRVCNPDLPTPSGYTLERAYYIGKDDIKAGIVKAVRGS